MDWVLSPASREGRDGFWGELRPTKRSSLELVENLHCWLDFR